MSKEKKHSTPESLLPRSPSFWENAMQRFRQNRLARFSMGIVWFLIFVAVFADFLAYDKPLYAVHKGTTYFPLFCDYLSDLGLYQWDAELINADWDELELESSVWPPVRYSPTSLDYKNAQRVSPFDEQRVENWKFWHFLGTDRDGRDVLSGLIHGTRISLSVGLVSMSIACFIGLLMGAFAGYFGDRRIRMSRIGIFLMLLGMVLGFFYGFQVRSYVLSEALASGFLPLVFQLFISVIIFVGVTTLFVLFSRLFSKVPWLNEKKYIWVDIIISRIIEIVSSIPALLLIITIAGLMEQGSIFMVMMVIGIIGWPGIARFTRGEMLRIRNQEYIEAARSMGYSELRIIFRHALPNAIAPVLVVIAFGVAGAILTESTLSFLSIGVPESTVTWGSLLNEARGDISAWWLAIFPGFAIFVTVTVFNLIGDALRDALDPKLKE